MSRSLLPLPVAAPAKEKDKNTLSLHQMHSSWSLVLANCCPPGNTLITVYTPSKIDVKAPLVYIQIKPLFIIHNKAKRHWIKLSVLTQTHLKKLFIITIPEQIFWKSCSMIMSTSILQHYVQLGYNEIYQYIWYHIFWISTIPVCQTNNLSNWHTVTLFWGNPK